MIPNPSPVTATFAANTATGTPINSILDQVADPRLTTRAPVAPGRTDIVFNGEQFVYVAPPISEEPEEPAEPEPES